MIPYDRLGAKIFGRSCCISHFLQYHAILKPTRYFHWGRIWPDEAKYRIKEIIRSAIYWPLIHMECELCDPQCVYQIKDVLTLGKSFVLFLVPRRQPFRRLAIHKIVKYWNNSFILSNLFKRKQSKSFWLICIS